MLMNGGMEEKAIYDFFEQDIDHFKAEEVEHAIRFMMKNKAIVQDGSSFALNVTIDDQLREYLEDLLEYGIVRYDSEYMNHEKFVLWNNYRMDQVQLKMLKDPDHNQKGTYFYGDEVIIFASLKKDASRDDPVTRGVLRFAELSGDKKAPGRPFPVRSEQFCI